MAGTDLAHIVTELDPAGERARERGEVALAERLARDGSGADELVATVQQFERGGAVDPVLAFRASGYRAQKTVERPPAPPGGAPTHL